MIIRQEQLSVFSQRSCTGFRDRLRAHLLRCFPGECETLGENRLRDCIRFGIKRAGQYGITFERDVCRYVDLMFVFGKSFDVGCPWASSVLKDDSIGNPTARMERLYTTAKAQLTVENRSLIQ